MPDTASGETITVAHRTVARRTRYGRFYTEVYAEGL